MVKYIICATRKAGLSHEEFSAYWRNHHGPLVRSVPEFARYVRKYVQCHLVKGASRWGTEALTMGWRNCGLTAWRIWKRPSASRGIWRLSGPMNENSSIWINSCHSSLRRTR